MQFADGLWIGRSSDWRNVEAIGAEGLLNVARDLPPPEGGTRYLAGECSCCEYMQTGLVDGPGNNTSDYCAAVLSLWSLMCRHTSVLVYDHEGSRAAAVAVMYLCLMNGRRPAGGGASNAHCWSTWYGIVGKIHSRLRISIPLVHSAHVEAYDALPFGILEELTR